MRLMKFVMILAEQEAQKSSYSKFNYTHSNENNAVYRDGIDDDALK
jgi:hypothetical protein